MVISIFGKITIIQSLLAMHKIIKIGFLTGLMFMFLLPVKAQKLTVNATLLDFGNVISGEPDTLDVVVKNNSSLMIMIDTVLVYQKDFRVLDKKFTLQPGDSVKVRLVFDPVHNIPYNTEMVLVTKSGEGQIAIDIRGKGRYKEAYYNPTNDKSEEALKTALKTLISGHTSLGYNTARDRMFMNIDNERVNGQGASKNTVTGIYTGNKAVGYSSRQDVQSNYGFNTEHTFPQGTFSSNEPMRSDLFHIFPTLASANSERGSKPFGTVSNPTWQQGGSKSNGSKFEPRPQQKGPTARAMLYFLIRYQNFNNYVKAADQDVLKNWGLLFTPSAIEKKRNDLIFGYQKNRNPFIDHPEFIERITNFIGNSKAPVLKSLKNPQDTVDFMNVSLTKTYTYNIVLVNDGNTDIDLTFTGVTGSELTIVNKPAKILPGESGNIELQYQPVSAQVLNEKIKWVSSVSSDTTVLPVIAQVVPVGVEEKQSGGIQVFPNPAKETVYIKHNLLQPGELAIFDSYGKRVYAQKNIYKAYQVDIKTWAPGFYIIIIKDNAGQYIFEKLIKL
jgi:endonuclease I